MPGTVLGTGNSVVDKKDVLPVPTKLMSEKKGYRLTEPFKYNTQSGKGIPYVEATLRSSLGKIGDEWQSKAGESVHLGIATWAPGCTKASLEGPSTASTR